ncbi:hypothetical protein BC941DRAFT_421842 [Chlamydoabsidia padenii]|nr:hypothetical protein BC941DRAFT_421842 [Chlamydoabsidia padenii]
MGKAKKVFTCTVCDDTFDAKVAYNRHMAAYHPEEGAFEKKYKRHPSDYRSLSSSPSPPTLQGKKRKIDLMLMDGDDNTSYEAQGLNVVGTENIRGNQNNDSLERQLDLTSYQAWVFNKKSKDAGFRPIPKTGREELRRLLHTVYNSISTDHDASNESAMAVIRYLDKKLRMTLVPQGMDASRFDIQKTQDMAEKRKAEIRQALHDRARLSLEKFYTKMDTERLWLKNAALMVQLEEDEGKDVVEERLDVIPVHLKKYVSDTPPKIAYDYTYYTLNYPSSSFS